MGYGGLERRLSGTGRDPATARARVVASLAGVDDGKILRRSVNTERALHERRPRLRGRAHLLAAVAAYPGGLAWVLASPPGRARLAIAGFAVAMTVMLTISATLHLKRWDAATYERLFRLDHSGIHVAIGGTGFALALLGLEGWPSRVLLTVAVGGAAVGILVEWLPFPPPRGLNSGIYLTLGWTPVVLLPWLWASSGATNVVLLLVGGVLYTVGAVVVGLRRPDPWPAWFGYHEIFHALVLAAIAVHAVMLDRLAARAG